MSVNFLLAMIGIYNLNWPLHLRCLRFSFFPSLHNLFNYFLNIVGRSFPLLHFWYSLVQFPLQGFLQGQADCLWVPRHPLLHWHIWMVPLQMLDHLELLLGPVGAVATAERLLLGVREVVMSETCRPPEGLVAQAARVWPIVTVLALVGLQYKTGLEGFAAFLANIGAHIAVLRVPVGTESICSVSAVLTLIAGIRLVPCRGWIYFLLNQANKIIYTKFVKITKWVLQELGDRYYVLQIMGSTFLTP